MLISPQSKATANQPTLSLRLSAIAESLSEGGVVCDVGSDHGALPLFLLCSGKCSSAIVTDLNEKPLERAKANLCEAGVAGKATFVLTDGIEAVLPMKPDSFVIAGMGGETIVGILDRGLNQIPVGTQFFLQPMTKVSSLRRYLYENGFCVLNEKLIFENDKFFIVIQAVYDGVLRSNLSAFYEFGEYLPKLNNIDSKKYFSSLLFSLESVIEGKKKANINFDEEIKRRKYLLHLLEEMNENQRD